MMSDAEFDGKLLELMARCHEKYEVDRISELWDTLVGKGRLRGSAERLITLGFLLEIWNAYTPDKVNYDITPEGFAHVRDGGALPITIKCKLDSTGEGES